MIQKIINPDSFRFDEPLVRMVGTFSRGFDTKGLRKHAAQFDDFIAEIKPRKGYAYLHLITTGALETYGSNNNGDAFPKEAREFRPFLKPDKVIQLDGGLKKYHDATFTKYASVFRNHCFPAGAAVRMADGSFRAIETLREGELVHTRTGGQPITKVFSRIYDGAMVTLVAGGREICSTVDHPIFCFSEQEERGLKETTVNSELKPSAASSIRKGDWLVTIPMSCDDQPLESSAMVRPLGGLVLRKVALIQAFQAAAPIPVYNLEVEGLHEYDVGGLLVHNCNQFKRGKPSGYIVKAAYNDEMSRGELIVGVDDKIWAQDLQKIAEDKPVYFSMAATVGHDTCNACGHQAHTFAEYCPHLRNDMLAMDKEGHQVYAINDAPIFHDISGVFKPADRIAFALRKVAGDRVVSSAQLALECGLEPRFDIFQKAASPVLKQLELLRKLAALEKEILAEPAGDCKDLLLPFLGEGGRVREFEDQDICSLREQEPPAMFGALRGRLIVMPMETFLKILMGSRFSEVEDLVPGARKALAGVFGRLLEEPQELCGLSGDDLAPGREAGLPAELLARLFERHSLADGPVQRRVLRIMVVAPPRRITLSKEAVDNRAADYLAREYGRYVLRFCGGLSPGQLHLSVAQTVANVL